MSKYQVDKLQAELMRIGYQLLADTGVDVRKVDPKVVPNWSRTHAEILFRRLR
jgi:hypothetical protein